MRKNIILSVLKYVGAYLALLPMWSVTAWALSSPSDLGFYGGGLGLVLMLGYFIYVTSKAILWIGYEL